MFRQKITYVETDGVHTNKLTFSKAKDNPIVVNVNPKKSVTLSKSRVYSIFKELFLPEGYPESVHADYVPYQIFDTIQSFANTIASTLTTHAILKGIGVGQSSATPIAAAITWVLKDGTGSIGRILFAWWQGSNLDFQSKRWRLFADILNDTANGIEIIVPYFTNLSAITLCLTTAIKAVVGVAGGATRMSLKQHLAVKANLGDIAAKEASQETCVHLLGSFIGLLVLLCLNEKYFFPLYIILVAIHISANYSLVKVLVMTSLNEDRYSYVIQDYILYHTISSPREINDRESIFSFENPAKNCFGFSIEIGSSFDKVLKSNLMESHDIRSLLAHFHRRKFLPVVDIENQKIYIILAKDVSDIVLLKAYFYSCFYALIVSHMLGTSSDVFKNGHKSPPSYPLMRILLFSKQCAIKVTKKTQKVSFDLLLAVDAVVNAEIYNFVNLLNESEWATKSNMLPVKFWRGGWI